VQEVTPAPDAHSFSPMMHALVQHALALQAPSAQAKVVDWYTQFCASFAHVASVVAFAHVFPTALQTGSMLHVHAAVPAVPVQLWRVPQATGAPYE
jgi:hypothetical protein